MLKIAAFIIPNIFLKKEIALYKKQVKYCVGSQIYLDHLPHCSILTTKVSSKFLTEKSIRKPIVIKSKIKTYDVYKKSIFNFDPITKNRTIFLKIRKKKFLTNLQFLLLKKIENYRVNEKTPKFKFQWMKNNYIKFGYPYVNESWNPHFTIASIKKNKSSKIFIDNFLKTKLKAFPREKLEKVYIYKIIKNKHKLLWKIKLKFK